MHLIDEGWWIEFHLDKQKRPTIIVRHLIAAVNLIVAPINHQPQRPPHSWIMDAAKAKDQGVVLKVGGRIDPPSFKETVPIVDEYSTWGDNGVVRPIPLTRFM